MRKFLLLLCALLGTVGAMAAVTTSYAQGSQVTSAAGIVDGGKYVVRVNGGSYITEANSQYEAPNSQNSITANAIFTFHQNGDVWNVECEASGNYWGTLPGAAAANFKPAAAASAGSWTFTFNGNNIVLTSNSYYINRSSGVMHGWGSTIALQIYNVEEVNVVNTIDDLSNNKCYTIRTYDRGWWVVPNEATAVTSTTKAVLATSATDLKQQFAFIYYDDTQDDANDGIYLYSVSAKKFISKSGNYTALTSGPGDKVTLLASQGNASFPTVVAFNGTNHAGVSNGYNPAIITHYNSLSDGGNRSAICEAASFDATEALSIIDSYFHPNYTVTYIVKDGSGNTLFTSDPQPTTNGANITTLPSEFQRSIFYSYNTIDVTISATGNTNVEFIATPKESTPVKYTADATSPIYYNLNIRSKYLVYNNEAIGEVTLQNESEPFNANASWAFVGEPYAGFKVINKTKGSDYYLTYTSIVTGGNSGADGSNNNIQFVASDDFADRYWLIDTNNNGFVLRMKENNNIYFHHQSIANSNGYLRTCSVSEWGAVHNDAGSTIQAVSDDEVLFSIYNSLSGNLYGTEIGMYNSTDNELSIDAINSTISAVKNVIDNQITAAYGDAYVALVELSGKIALVTPTAGFYRLKNVATDKYLRTIAGPYAYNTTTKGVYANGAENSVETVIELRENGGKLYMYNQGYGYGWVVADKSVGAGVAYASSNADKYVNWLPGTSAGQIAFAICYGNGTGNYASYLMKGIYVADSDEAVIGGIDYTVDAAQWIVEPLSNLTIALNTVGSESYATTYLPFGVTLDDAAEAYVMTTYTDKDGDWLVPASIGQNIPAGTPVFIKSATAAASVTATIDNTIPATNSENELQGAYFSAAHENDVYVLNAKNGEVGFYTLDGTLAANRAYLPKTNEVKGFRIKWDDTDAISSVEAKDAKNATIFNLAGQRVNAAQKGVFIVNGKKVVLK